jgi:hypothetical protein
MRIVLFVWWLLTRCNQHPPGNRFRRASSILCSYFPLTGLTDALADDDKIVWFSRPTAQFIDYALIATCLERGNRNPLFFLFKNLFVSDWRGLHPIKISSIPYKSRTNHICWCSTILRFCVMATNEICHVTWKCCWPTFSPRLSMIIHPAGVLLATKWWERWGYCIIKMCI